MLKIEKLTMRFGGLTAVSELDLDVPAKSIYSVIGPNGAGKTTVFNAVTGIYPPTSGAVLCNGKPLERPFGWRVILTCLVIGALTSLAALLISVDPNRLWRAAINRNMQDPALEFKSAEGWRDFWGYLGGHLAVERRPTDSRWIVVPWNASEPVLAVANLKDDARVIAEGLDAAVRGAMPLAEVKPAANAEILASDTMISGIQAARTSQFRAEWLAMVAGFALGVAGVYSVWTRARRTPDVIATGGIARTFQNIRLFGSMTVLENVQVAIDRHSPRRALGLVVAGACVAVIMFLSPALWLQIPLLLIAVVLFALAQIWKQADETDSCRRAFAALDFVGLQSKASMLANSLAYGQQRRLEIARALALSPSLLLLDEPAAGMNPTESGELTELIRRIRDRGVTVVLIEHHMKVVMGISDRIAVLDHGVKIAEGSPGEVRSNAKVVEAYLGKDEDAHQ